jgi:hypothetical protein
MQHDCDERCLFHKQLNTLDALQAEERPMLSLSPYSQDFNPKEKMWV